MNKNNHECCGHCHNEKEPKVCTCEGCEDKGTTDCKCGCLDEKHEHHHDHHEENHEQEKECCHHDHVEDGAHECCGHCKHNEQGEHKHHNHESLKHDMKPSNQAETAKVCTCPGCMGEGSSNCSCGCLAGDHECSHDDHEHHHHHHESHEHMHHDHHEHEGHEHHSGHHGHHHHGNLNDFIIRFLISLIFTIPILILSPMIQTWFNYSLDTGFNGYISFGLATILLVYGGKPFYMGAYYELKEKAPAMMTLVTLAIVVAYGYSTAVVFGLPGMDFFWELATLIAVMLLGHYFEMKSSMVASNALESITKLLPSTAHLISEDGVIDVAISNLKLHQVVLIKPGEKIPVDGMVIEGTSTVDESLITGESKPIIKTINDIVIGGTINGDSTLKVKITKLGKDTYVSQVVNLVNSALESKSKTERLADIAAKYLFYVSISVALITWLVWGLLGMDGAFIAEKVVTVIVIACPHALGVAIPLVTSISTTLAAKHALLIKNRAQFEQARKINAVVFDKTGTLTEGKFVVTSVFSKHLSEREVIEIAANLESSSTHPIAKGILNHAQSLNITPKPYHHFKNIPGLGITALNEDKTLGAVSEQYLIQENIPYDNAIVNQAMEHGETLVFVIENQMLHGMISLKDTVKPNAKEAIAQLNKMGIETYMLTGDHEVVAKNIAHELGITHYSAGILPHEKASFIESLKQTKKVAMVGDGINDAPALASANLGIAIGAGTDLAIDSADIILVKNDPNDVVKLLSLAKKTYRKMVENLIWALFYNVITLPLAAGIFYNVGFEIAPSLGAVFMSLSTIIVAVNAQLLRIKK